MPLTISPLPKTSDDAREAAPLELVEALLARASSIGDTYAIQHLLDLGASIEGSGNARSRPLHLAARAGHHKAVLLLLSLGADINAPETGDAYNRKGISALSAAVHCRKVFQALLSAGADPEVRDDSGSAALCHAVRSAEPDAVEILCKAGSDVNSFNNSKLGPIHYAGAKGDASSLRTLLEHGAKTTPLCPDGPSALHICSLHCHDSDCLEILWSAGARLTDPEAATLGVPLWTNATIEFGISWLTARLRAQTDAADIAIAAPEPASPPHTLRRSL